MSDIIVICNWDDDSSTVHPITKLPLMYQSGYIISVKDKEQFIDDLINNRFELSEKVHSSFLNMLEVEKEYNKLAGYEESNFLELNSGFYDFGNYHIEIIDVNSINIH